MPSFSVSSVRENTPIDEDSIKKLAIVWFLKYNKDIRMPTDIREFHAYLEKKFPDALDVVEEKTYRGWHGMMKSIRKSVKSQNKFQDELAASVNSEEHVNELSAVTAQAQSIFPEPTSNANSPASFMFSPGSLDMLQQSLQESPISPVRSTIEDMIFNALKTEITPEEVSEYYHSFVNSEKIKPQIAHLKEEKEKKKISDEEMQTRVNIWIKNAFRYKNDPEQANDATRSEILQTLGTPGAPRKSRRGKRQLSYAEAGAGADSSRSDEGYNEEKENEPSASASISSLHPGGPAEEAIVDLSQPVPVTTVKSSGAPDVKVKYEDPQSQSSWGNTAEPSKVLNESTRQTELPAHELVTLQMKADYTEVMDTKRMKLATDASRGNLGAGTTADMQSADLWGNQFSTSGEDLAVGPERFLSTTASGMTIETETSKDDAENVYSFLPFAKLGGDVVWIPRHVRAARFFFTSEDYAELVSHVQMGDPLTLDKTNEVDSTLMMSTILKMYGVLKRFCELSPLLPASASIEQIYAEWLEMKQISTALARYQQITGGMYENTELSLRGGIRAAVASALKPFIEGWNKMHPKASEQIRDEPEPSRPLSASMFGGGRAGPAGIVQPEEYNPQFSYDAPDLKFVKFSIPTI